MKPGIGESCPMAVPPLNSKESGLLTKVASFAPQLLPLEASQAGYWKLSPLGTGEP